MIPDVMSEAAFIQGATCCATSTTDYFLSVAFSLPAFIPPLRLETRTCSLQPQPFLPPPPSPLCSCGTDGCCVKAQATGCCSQATEDEERGRKNGGHSREENGGL